MPTGTERPSPLGLVESVKPICFASGGCYHINGLPKTSNESVYDHKTPLDRTSATNALGNSIRAIRLLRKVEPLSSEHMRWILDTRYLLEEIFGQGSRIYRTFANLKFHYEGEFLASDRDFEAEGARRNLEAYQNALGMADGILHAAIDQINRKGLEGVYEGKDTPKESSEIVKILSLIEIKLRKTVRDKPKNESEVTDALESLFIGADLDKEFTREKENLVYSSKTYIPDFAFRRISTVVEAKLCDTPKREKEIIAEINDDILAYKTAYANLIFVVYDLGMIRDRDMFAGSIEQAHQQVIIRVIKH